jgi:hypothetical protein
MFVPVPPGPAQGQPTTPPVPLPREYELDLRAAVGPNADYFLRCWHPVLTNRGSSAGFSRIAFFLPFVWLVYRRMYRRALLLLLVFVALGAADTAVAMVLFGREKIPPLVVVVELVVAASLCGGYANGWYLQHARQLVTDARAQHDSSGAVREELAARGGTDPGSAFGLILVLVLLEFLFRFGGIGGSGDVPPPGPNPPAEIRARHV